MMLQHLAHPEARLSGNLDASRLVADRLCRIIIGLDATQEGDPRLTDLLVRCATIYEDLFHNQEKLLAGALEAAIDAHLSTLKLGPLSMNYAHHIDSVIEYYGRLMALNSFNLSLDIPRRFFSVGIRQLSQGLADPGAQDGKLVEQPVGELLVGDKSRSRDKIEKEIHLDIGIACLTCAIELGPEDNPELPEWLRILAMAHQSRYFVQVHSPSHINDFEKSFEYQSRALALTPYDHPQRSELMMELVKIHAEQLIYGTEDSDDARKGFEQYSQKPTYDSNNREDLRILLTCARSFELHFHINGGEDNINGAIQALSDVTLILPHDTPPELRGVMLSNLGALHRERFQYLGKLVDIDTSIELYTEALSLIPHNLYHERFPALLEICLSLAARFHRLGDPQCMRRVEAHMQEVLTDPTKWCKNHTRINLAMVEVSLVLPNNRSAAAEIRIGKGEVFPVLDTDSLSIKNALIQLARNWMTVVPEGHKNIPIYLTYLGRLQIDKYNYTQNTKYLDNGIEYLTRAVSLQHNRHPQLPCLLHELSKLLSHRMEQGQDINQQDFDRAVECADRALSLLPDDHPDRSEYLTTLALVYGGKPSQEDPTGPNGSKALHYIREAALSAPGYPSTRFRAAHVWAQAAINWDNVQVALEAFQVAMSIVPEIIWLGDTITRRFAEASMIGGLASDSAAAAISQGNYLLALEWLEEGRSVVWNQTLQLRTPLEELKLVDSQLALKLKLVADELNNASVTSPGPEASSLPPGTSEERARRHRRLAEDYSQTLAQIRSLDGFRHFLRPKPASELFHAAHTGPVVIVNVSKDRCDALILIPGSCEVISLPLPDVSVNKVAEACDQLDVSLKLHGVRDRGIKVKGKEKASSYDPFSDVLLFLWDAIAKPVLDRLGYIARLSFENMPHLTWCTTGRLALLPLHAAGVYDQPQSKLSDYVISSYAPTLSALLYASSVPSTPHTKLLAIDQEHTPGRSNLPGVKQELSALEVHAQEPIVLSRISSVHANRKAVLSAMEKSDWVHLACHAGQNFADPMKSGFFLQDGTLSLNDIIQNSFKDKGLAFLSACQTARGDERLADEAVHLASGMLLAGYKSVIATMWSVKDEDAPIIADMVYERLLKGGKMDHKDSARALHAAVNELRMRNISASSHKKAVVLKSKIQFMRLPLVMVRVVRMGHRGWPGLLIRDTTERPAYSHRQRCVNEALHRGFLGELDDIKEEDDKENMESTNDEDAESSAGWLSDNEPFVPSTSARGLAEQVIARTTYNIKRQLNLLPDIHAALDHITYRDLVDSLHRSAYEQYANELEALAARIRGLLSHSAALASSSQRGTQPLSPSQYSRTVPLPPSPEKRQYRKNYRSFH